MKKYFKNVQDVETCKKMYKKFAMALHPDRKGGDEAKFVEMGREYELTMKELRQNSTKENTTKQDFSKFDKDFKRVLDEVLQFDNVDVEICGDFIWIGGNTYPYRKKFVDLGCKWAKKKQKWFFAPSWWTPSRGRKSQDMSKIRATYGSQVVKSDKKEHDTPKRLK